MPGFKIIHVSKRRPWFEWRVKARQYKRFIFVRWRQYYSTTDELPSFREVLNSRILCPWWWVCNIICAGNYETDPSKRHRYIIFNTNHSTMIGIGLILLFIVLWLCHQCVIRDNKLFWLIDLILNLNLYRTIVGTCWGARQIHVRLFILKQKLLALVGEPAKYTLGCLYWNKNC